MLNFYGAQFERLEEIYLWVEERIKISPIYIYLAACDCE
jgi:hypothetical protein